MEFETITMDKEGRVATVTLNRPVQRNAVNLQMCRDMIAAFDDIESDPAVRVTVLAGAGKVFCSGMDLTTIAEGQSDAVLFGQHGFAGFVRRLRNKPVIAAVHGAAVAGGFELLLACDLILASDTTKFGLPEPKRGLIAGGGGAIRLHRHVAPVIANEILLTGDNFGATEALNWGLINRVVPEDALKSTALEMAERIAVNAPKSLAATLGLTRAISQDNEDDYWEISNDALRERLTSEDAQEGAQAFFERRAPNWTD